MQSVNSNNLLLSEKDIWQNLRNTTNERKIFGFTLNSTLKVKIGIESSHVFVDLKNECLYSRIIFVF